MKKRILSLIALSLLFCFSLSGCSIGLKAVDNLLRAPKLTGENADLNKAFEDSVRKGKDSSIILKRPSNGSYRSSFIMYDLDGDGIEEAFVFYALSEDKTATRLNVLSRTTGAWSSVADFPGTGIGVYEILFSDLNNDGIKEIIVAWKITETTTIKNMTIYGGQSSVGLAKDVLKPRANENYSALTVLDIDSDGKNEVLFTHFDTTTERSRAFARVLKMDSNGDIKHAGEAALNPKISSYTSFKTEYIGEMPRVYIDAHTGGVQMLTEMLYWDKENGKLIAPFYISEAGVNPLTLRNVAVESFDINSDRKIEIPLTSVLPGSSVTGSDSSISASLYIVNWSVYENEKFNTVRRTYYNLNDMYSIVYPDDWQNRVAITQNLTDRLTVFSYYSSGSKKTGPELFSIKAFPVVSFHTDLLGDYQQFLSNKDYTYAYRITQEGEKFGITEGFITSEFTALKTQSQTTNMLARN
ncbi:MAG: FG-GAP repeat domain-containing protein [Acutalibacteraceae bacterium]|jgi:hypothetical protein